MSQSKNHLEKLHSLVDNFKNQSGDVVIGTMIPEFAELVVTLNNELDKAQTILLRLTWAVTALTVVMLFVGVAQLYVSIFPNQVQDSQKIQIIEKPIKDLKSSNSIK